VAAKVSWRGPGVLFLSPTGEPWSVWLFWSEDGVFAGWYVNLELLHRRDSTSTWTGDHELDVWIRANALATQGIEAILTRPTAGCQSSSERGDEFSTRPPRQARKPGYTC